MWRDNCSVNIINTTLSYNVLQHLDKSQLLELVIKLTEQNNTLAVQVQQLQLQVAEFRQIAFGGHQEKFKANPNATDVQLDLFPNDKLADVIVVKEKQIPAHVQKTTAIRVNHPGRNPLPSHLRREEIKLQPDEDVTGLAIIGEEITEVLEYTQGELYVKKYSRLEYIKPSEDKLSSKRIIAEPPSLPIAKSYVGGSLLAQMLTSKYVDHLPMYRQLQIFSRQKVIIPDSTVVGWVEAAYKLLIPLYEEYKKQILASNYIQVDETTINVLDKNKKGKCHQGYYWVYLDALNNNVIYEYELGRASEYPKEVLANYSGCIQVDGYKGYDIFKSNPNIKVAHCWAHVRRKFFDIKEMYPDQANTILLLLQNLYAIERKCDDDNNTAEQRCSIRFKESRSILVKILRALRKIKVEHQLKNTPLNTAIQYTLSLWKGLVLFSKDGNINLDNNPIENKVRPVALGRKNYLFAGSHEGAKRSGMFYSLFASCKAHNINPVEWLTYVLENINDHPINKIKELLPQNYYATINKK